MSEYTVIQRLLFLVSSLLSLSFYAFVVWRKRHPIAGMTGWGFLPPRRDVQHWTARFLSSIQSVDKQPVPASRAVSQTALDRKKSSKDRRSVSGDWLAPIIVCFLVIGMIGAIVGFLLGEG